MLRVFSFLLYSHTVSFVLSNILKLNKFYSKNEKNKCSLILYRKLLLISVKTFCLEIVTLHGHGFDT